MEWREILYTFRNTEKTKEKGSDYETFSLLYLLAHHNASNHIDLVLVDTFNDATGCDDGVGNLWDVQSKGHKDPNPKKIGSFLFTLWENFCSGYPFLDYILLLQEINTSYLVDTNIDFFGMENINSKAYIRIRNGLEAEIRRRGDLNDADPIDDEGVDVFLKTIKFKVWKLSKGESLKKLMPLHNGLMVEETFYDRIFGEIRDRQSALKNICIEGCTIQSPSDVLGFKKQITKIEIVTLLVNRVIGSDLFGQMNTPNHFVQFLPSSNPEDVKDIVLDCNAALSRTWFNKNNKKAIWRLLESIMLVITSGHNLSVADCISQIPDSVVKAVPTLSDLHLKFFISRVLEGKQ